MVPWRWEGRTMREVVPERLWCLRQNVLLSTGEASGRTWDRSCWDSISATSALAHDGAIRDAVS